MAKGSCVAMHTRDTPGPMRNWWPSMWSHVFPYGTMHATRDSMAQVGTDPHGMGCVARDVPMQTWLSL